MIPRTLLAYLEAEVVAAREHLERATAALETAQREIAETPNEPTAFDGVLVKCGNCGAKVPEDEAKDHIRRCQAAAKAREFVLVGNRDKRTTRALRSAVMEEAAMDALARRPLEI